MSERLEGKQEIELSKEKVQQVLLRAKEVCDSFGTEDAQVIVKGAGFGELVQDTEIKPDKVLGQVILDAIKEISGGVSTKIVVEGLGETKLADDEIQVTWYVDPLDASLNLFKKLEDPARKTTLGLPYTTVISVFKGEVHQYSECITAGVIDLRSGDIWLAEKGNGCFLNSRMCRTSGRKEVDLSSGIVIGELYYPQNRELLVKLFEGQKGWLRNPGSAAYEMALVACGYADAFICDRQKSHELGGANLLVTEAGGYACDFNGDELGPREYQFNSQVPVILAATPELAQEILQRIQSSKNS